MMASSTGKVMEKPGQQDQQQALKCPRCDSSNTKFCYYNNYSLSQPRHFCKACKRYWTRGGTLRNVPVGGGCRKNKRVKKPTSAVDSPSSSSAPTANPNVQPRIDLSSTSNQMNPLFYGLPTNPSELNLPYPRFNSRVSNVDTVSGYDQMNGLGLGFSSGLMDYQNGFNPKQIQEVATSNSLLSSYPIFGSSTSNTDSLIASSLQQQKFMSGGLKDIRAGNSFLGLVPYEDMQMQGKEVKMEESQNRLDWNFSYQNQIEMMGSSSDPSIMWNTAWIDPANIGSSVTSLI